MRGNSSAERERTSLAKTDLLVLAGGEDPVDHAAVEVDSFASLALSAAARPLSSRSKPRGLPRGAFASPSQAPADPPILA
jgi:hypothetical protein